MQARGYVSLERPSEGSKTKVFIPSEQGELTDAKLQEFFKDIINVSYTAGMEHHLDEIAAGKRNNIEEVRTFYNEFEPLLENAYEHMAVSYTHLKEGKKKIIGIDEAGRGPIAGPLVVAAVSFPVGFSHESIYDSKKLSEKKRKALFQEMCIRDSLVMRPLLNPFIVRVCVSFQHVR